MFAKCDRGTWSESAGLLCGIVDGNGDEDEEGWEGSAAAAAATEEKGAEEAEAEEAGAAGGVDGVMVATCNLGLRLPAAIVQVWGVGFVRFGVFLVPFCLDVVMELGVEC